MRERTSRAAATRTRKLAPPVVRLNLAVAQDRAAYVKSCRAALTEARATLKQDYARQPNPDRMLRQHAAAVDELIRKIAADVPLPAGSAIVAVGGYGRGYLFPSSDVDIVILPPAREDDAVKAALESFVGLLWDVGLEPGIAVRSIAECVAEAAKDVTVATSLLEARHVWGDADAANGLTQTLQHARSVRAFCEAKVDEQRARHARHNDVALNLEPNIKESPGGLRDLQTVMWIARAAGIGEDWTALAERGLLSEFEAKTIAKLRLTLVDLRIRLHFLAGRREDRLVFDHQTALAHELGMAGTAGKRASELLMQRYYLAAKGVWQLCSILIPALMEQVAGRKRDQVKKIDAEFALVNGNIAAQDVTVFERDPLAILRAFLALQRVREAEFFEPETLRALWRAVHRIDAGVRDNPETWRLFLESLRSEKVTFALRRMSRYGVLGRLIPAFGKIVGQMQHDLFHVYTVDEHILMVIRNLRRLVLPRFAHEFPFCHELAREFARPEVLYLAALFHDIAKGRGGDHSELGKKDARVFCKRLALSPYDVELVAWLVEHHLRMSSVAQKQDLGDPDVISQFAQLVRDERRLTALYLLTVADVRGTSPHVWNNWKARLLEQLFRATRRLLRGDAVNNEHWVANKQAEALAIHRATRTDAADGDRPALWDIVDDSYFQRFDADEMAWHAAEWRASADRSAPSVKVRTEPGEDGEERLDVLVMAPDQPGLFARITGFFEKLSCDIVAARIYTTRDGFAIDEFQVLPKTAVRAPHAIAHIERELARKLAAPDAAPPSASGRLARQVRHFPIAPEIAITRSRRAPFWELSVICADRPGLLSAIARTLVDHAINLHDARITTLGSRAEDVFVVAHPRLGDATFDAGLKDALLEAIKV
ncbi:MAG: [protein-PII] uridylyltransferase [Betaproteobacteria bacterium]|nr:[protein-PII] uridylyltransferase [Betaproteobacteria bacterium]